MGTPRKRRNIVTTITKTSIRALLLGLALATPTRAFAQAAPTEAPTFDDLVAAEVGKSGGLTADEVARRSAGSSYGVRARSQELLAAAAEVDRAAYAYVPRVTVSASYMRLSDTTSDSAGIALAPGAPPLEFETPLNQYTFQASVSVPVSDYLFRIGKARSSAQHGEAAARQRVISEKLSAAADARVNYYSWVRARLGVIVAEQALAQARGHLADAKAALAAGTVSPADVMRVESEVARSELLVTTSRHLSELTEEQIRTAMHDQPGPRYLIGEDVRQPASPSKNARLEDLWVEARRSRPELRALDAEEKALERSTAAEQTSYGPRLDLVGTATYANPNQRIFPQEEEFRGSWEAGARMTWVLSDLPSTSARVRAGNARARAVAAERAALGDQIRLQVMSAFQERVEARVAEQTTARGLAAAEESYRTRRLLFQNGRATTVELLDAETELTRARLEAIGARIDGRVAEVRLAYAVGRSDRP
jgi:outer membrane protein